MQYLNDAEGNPLGVFLSMPEWEKMRAMLPANGLACDQAAYDSWFRAKVHESLADTRPPVPHDQVMNEAQAIIDEKRRARS